MKAPRAEASAVRSGRGAGLIDFTPDGTKTAVNSFGTTYFLQHISEVSFLSFQVTQLS